MRLGHFRDRTEAGCLLAAQLTDYANHPDVVVLGLPRGGVPVAFEVAEALNVPLDVCLVRKLGVPGRPELAMGAIAEGETITVNSEIVTFCDVGEPAFEQVLAQEKQELKRRECLYRPYRPRLNLRDRIVILIDDGVATGSTLQAALETIRLQYPKTIIIAVPVAAPATFNELETQVDQVVCLITPQPLYSISCWYQDFSQTSDQQVQQLLAQANQTKNSVETFHNTSLP